MVPAGQTEQLIELPAYGAHRSIAHHGQRGAQIHARHIAGVRTPRAIGALIEQAHAHHAVVFHQRPGYRHAGPDLYGSPAHRLRASPLHELADGEQQAAIFAEKRRSPGQLEGVIARQTEEAQQPVGRAQSSRATAGRAPGLLADRADRRSSRAPPARPWGFQPD